MEFNSPTDNPFVQLTFEGCQGLCNTNRNHLKRTHDFFFFRTLSLTYILTATIYILAKSQNVTNVKKHINIDQALHC